MSRTPQKNKCVLWAPEEFWLLSDDDLQLYRCGPGRGILEKLIPDIWRFGWPLVKPLVITPSCRIHDFCYETGPDTIAWKNKADRGFQNNMIRQVEFEAACYSRWLYPITMVRLKKAQAYYHAVKIFGGPAFWSGRNPTSQTGLCRV